MLKHEACKDNENLKFCLLTAYNKVLRMKIVSREHKKLFEMKVLQSKLQNFVITSNRKNASKMLVKFSFNVTSLSHAFADLISH